MSVSVEPWTLYSNETCTNDPDWSASEVLVGDCDADIAQAPWAQCYRLSYGSDGLLVPNATGTELRCGCNKLFPFDGVMCDETGVNNTVWWFSVLAFGIQAFISFYQFVRTAYGVKELMAKEKGPKRKVDDITATMIFLMIGNFFTVMMLVCFTGRTSPNGLTNEEFAYLLFSFPLVVLFICQSMLALALSWLSVAIKSSVGNDASVSKYKRLRVALKSWAIILFVFTVLLTLTDRITLVTLLANFSSLILSISLRIGGARIHNMLINSSASDQKTKNIATAMKSTYQILIFSQPLSLFLGVAYTIVYTSVITTGVRNGWGISTTVAGMVLMLQLTSEAVCRFIYRIRINVKSKVGPGGAKSGVSTMSTKSTSVSPTTQSRTVD
ncbi:hypothetical protein TL16_g09149 [Triparma laevis f. inornata]|uniref:Uncharacterized protein n=2 Tax=Triparma laevis TaxID=1534972 RepID=A0A9W6ZGF9_9STRA|nr:hypothetical protein TrLO_g5834 [Triparma laevis f. longispina]GMH82112.1 hypothetical protein TL16_g09149 [Triparma laevis f. inornata]